MTQKLAKIQLLFNEQSLLTIITLAKVPPPLAMIGDCVFVPKMGPIQLTENKPHCHNHATERLDQRQNATEARALGLSQTEKTSGQQKEDVRLVQACHLLRMHPRVYPKQLGHFRKVL